MKKRRLFDIGHMRHRISVYTVTRVDDGSGGFDRSDPSEATKIGDYWAHVQPVTARERQWGEQFTEVTTHTCWLRYHDAVASLEGGILRFRGVDYYIEQAYDPDNLKNFLVLTLREGGPL
jgi:head-tail adaptor